MLLVERHIISHFPHEPKETINNRDENLSLLWTSPLICSKGNQLHDENKAREEDITPIEDPNKHHVSERAMNKTVIGGIKTSGTEVADLQVVGTFIPLRTRAEAVGMCPRDPCQTKLITLMGTIFNHMIRLGDLQVIIKSTENLRLWT